MNTLTSIADGRFTLSALLGEGGMARVYRAYDHRLKRWRAIKLLLPQYVRRRKLRERFEAEAQALALLEHQNIVRIYDVGSSEDQSWIVMEICDGGSLEDWIDEHGPMPPKMAVDVMLAVCDGLEVAHQEGIIHRDLKPQNILIDAKGVVKLGDFGIAQVDHHGLTRTGAAMGTDGYMPPEQRENAKSIEATGDIYAMGATLFTLVTARADPHLFAADHEPDKLRDVPGSLRPIVAKCTAYRPADRLPSVRVLKAALRMASASLDAVPANTPPLVWRPMAAVDVPLAPPTLLPSGGTAARRTGPTAPPSSVPPAAPVTVDFSGARGTILPPGEHDAASDLVSFSDKTTPPDAFLQETPVSGMRSTHPPERESKFERGQSYGGFQVVYEQPAEDPVEDSRFTGTLQGRTAPPKEDRDDAPRSDAPSLMRPIQAGAGWALRELWRGVTEVLAALFQAAGNPVGFALPGLLAVSLLFAIGAGVEAVKGAKVVNEAREGYWTQYGVFYREVERQRALPQRLIEQGGNAAVLEDALLAYDRARGSEAKKVAAERLAAMMAAEYALLETRGELPHAVRQSMKTKVTGLMERRRALDGAELRWREAGATSRGRLALALGRAEAAPLVAVDR